MSQKEDSKWTLVPNVVTSTVLKKYTVYLLASQWIQTHLKMQFFVHFLLQSQILPINLTSKKFDADRKVTFFVISPFVNLFLWTAHKTELPYEMKTL